MGEGNNHGRHVERGLPAYRGSAFRTLLRSGRHFLNLPAIQEHIEGRSKMKRTSIQVILALVSVAAATALPKIAVLDIVAGKGVEASITVPVAESIMEAMVNSKDFTILDRANIEKVLHEQEFDLSAMVSDDQAAKAGHYLGADYIVVGSAQALDNEYFVIAKMIDVRTGAITAQCSGKSVGKQSELVEMARALGDKLAKNATASSLKATIGEKLPVASISMNGKPDSWSAVAPLFVSDSTAFMGEPKYGLRYFYICTDSEYLYWRADFRETSPLVQMPRGTDKGIACHLAMTIDASKRLELGLYHDMRRGHDSTYARILDLSSGVSTKIGTPADLAYNSSAKMVVGRIPLSTIAEYCRGILPVLFQVGNFNGKNWSDYVQTDSCNIDFSK
jgi:TolB-like protein